MEKVLQPTSQKQMITRDYYMNNHMVIKWTTQGKKDKFLEMYNLSQRNQGETENMNRLIIRNDIKSVIKKFSTNISPEPDSFIDDYYQVSEFPW